MPSTDATTPSPPPAQDPPDLARALLEAARDLTRAAARAAGRGERHTLTGAQMDALLTIARSPGITVGEVAERLNLAKNTVSTHVGQLDRAGLVERSTDEADARLSRLTLTPDAEQRMTQWRARRAQAVRAALDETDPAARTALSAALPALVSLVEAVERAAARAREAG